MLQNITRKGHSQFYGLDTDQAEKVTNPWLSFVADFFAECRRIEQKPWANTGLRPMTFAARIYHEQQEFQAALETNGDWDSDPRRPIDNRMFVDPDQIFVDYDEWNDDFDYRLCA
jgi:hypothetical protein